MYRSIVRASENVSSSIFVALELFGLPLLVLRLAEELMYKSTSHIMHIESTSCRGRPRPRMIKLNTTRARLKRFIRVNGAVKYNVYSSCIFVRASRSSTRRRAQDDLFEAGEVVV